MYLAFWATTSCMLKSIVIMACVVFMVIVYTSIYLPEVVLARIFDDSLRLGKVRAHKPLKPLRRRQCLKLLEQGVGINLT